MASSRPTSPKTKLLLVGPLPPPLAGVEVMTEVLVNAYRVDPDFELIHLNTQDPRDNSNKGKLDLNNVLLALKHLLTFFMLLVRNRPQVTYVPISQNFLGFLRDGLFILLAKRLGSKTLIHLHGGFFDQFYASTRGFQRWFIQTTFKSVDLGIVLGHSLKGIFGDLLPPERVRVVYNGIDGFMSSKATRVDSDSQEKIHVLFLASLFETKGYVDLIRAAGVAVKEDPRLHFTIAGGVGEPQVFQRAKELVDELGLTGRVEFPGVVAGAAKEKLFLESDMFVFPTFYPYEGQPVVVLEAMAAGLPVISTPRGCIPECVLDGKTGFLVPEHGIDEIARRILELAKSPELRAQLGAQGRKHFEEHFTTDKYVEGIKALVKELSGARAARSA